MNILIAEDEADIRELLRISLQKENYNVFAAKDGLEALEIYKNNAIDLAILDVMMPKLDGFNLLRKIRETSTVPVIFLTARSEEMNKILGLGIGADDYLCKPFSINELIARVKANLRRSVDYVNLNKVEDEIISYGDLSINTNSCSACLNNEPIDLNAKEYKLLLHFMKNPERVYTKKQLYSAVWDDDYYYDDNTIMVHISHLRNKIEADSQVPEYIKTIRGIGYKLHKTGVKNEK